MTKSLLRICLGLCVWALVLLGSLMIAQAPGDWGHPICGPWGCGPPLQSLVACHLAWLVAILPPAVLLVRSVSVKQHARRWLGGLLVMSAIVGLCVVVGQQHAGWWQNASERQRPYFWHRCGFVAATSVDLPMVQCLAAGGLLLGWPSRRADHQPQQV